MRRFVFAALTAGGLLFGSHAAAQVNGGPYGLGVGLSTFSLADFEASLMPRIYAPIMAGEGVLLEPSLGVLRVSNDVTSETFLVVGTGILFLMEATEGGRMYVGPRIGVIRASAEETQTNLTLSAVAGGEYFLRPQFSLGGEAGLRWIDLADGNLISTTAEFRVRWYFP